MTEADPGVMSTFGLVLIMVWGLAYLGAAASNANIRWLADAFAVDLHGLHDDRVSRIANTGRI